MERERIDALARDLAEVLARHLGGAVTVLTPDPPARRAPSRAGVATWATPWCDAWSSAYGGTAPGARIAGAVGPLRRDGAEDEALLRSWVEYLERTPAQFASPQHWAARWRSYLPEHRPAPAAATRAHDTAAAVAAAVLRRRS